MWISIWQTEVSFSPMYILEGRPFYGYWSLITYELMKSNKSYENTSMFKLFFSRFHVISSEVVGDGLLVIIFISYGDIFCTIWTSRRLCVGWWHFKILLLIFIAYTCFSFNFCCSVTTLKKIIEHWNLGRKLNITIDSWKSIFLKVQKVLK